MRLRRINNIVHRDLGYFFAGTTLIYAVSGLAVNHVDDWNPSFVVHRDRVDVSAPVEPSQVTKQWVMDVLTPLGARHDYRSHDFPSEGKVKIYLDDGSLFINLVSGEGEYEVVKRPTCGRNSCSRTPRRRLSARPHQARSRPSSERSITCRRNSRTIHRTRIQRAAISGDAYNRVECALLLALPAPIWFDGANCCCGRHVASRAGCAGHDDALPPAFARGTFAPAIAFPAPVYKRVANSQYHAAIPEPNAVSQIFQPLLFLLARSTTGDLQKQIEYLQAENELLRKRVSKQRIFLDADERARLLELGMPLGSAIRQLITIADYSTFRRWVRAAEGKPPRPGKGRPRIAKLVRDLIIQIANDTGWGYSRILGELRKLGVGKISRQSVKNVLVASGIDPGPKRGRGTWSEFLEIHADTLWQIDFFSKRIWTLQGPRQVFALAFVHGASRRVFVTPATSRPDATWMTAQASAFLAYTQQQNLGCQMLMRDPDGKYSADFDRFFLERNIRVKPVGPRAPNLNAFVERWIQSLKHEALNHFVVFGLEQFDHIVSEYVAYYHACRPHQGIGNRLICHDEDDEPPPVVSLAEVKCEVRHGGLLKHYYRAA